MLLKLSAWLMAGTSELSCKILMTKSLIQFQMSIIWINKS